MQSESLIVILAVGVIAGWLAGQLVRGTGYGLINDLVIGVIGAFIGGWLLPRLGIPLAAGIIGAIINATVGAVLLLYAPLGKLRHMLFLLTSRRVLGATLGRRGVRPASHPSGTGRG